MRLLIVPMLFMLASFVKGSLIVPSEEGWLAFGDMRGYVEPCGCDPSADLGGIQRDAVFLQRERALTPDLFLFNLGNNLPPVPKDEPHKIPILLEAVRELKPHAVLFNRLEAAGYKLKAGAFQKIPYVASNLKSPRSYPEVSPSLKVGGTFITGFVEPRGLSEKAYRAFSKKTAESWKVSAKGAKEKVLLFDGSEDLLQKIEELGIFDLVISSNARPLDAVVGPEERDQPSLLQRLDGKVRMVPVGGQGFLRGGVLLTKKAESLQNLLGTQTCNPGMGGIGGDCSKPPLKTVEDVTWLTRDYAVPSPLDELYERYQKASSDVYARLAKQRAPDLKNSPFAGSEACKSCHPQAYESWQKSGHAHALATLEKAGKDKDPECVTCHVLGYKDKGGFASKELSPQFANVNCENCHGARKAHTKNPTVKHAMRGKSKDVCTSCHHGTHTSNFQFDEYWPKIKHGQKSE